MKNIAMVCAIMGFAFCAYADNAPPKLQSPAIQARPNQAPLNSFSIGSGNSVSTGTAGNARGTVATKGAAINGAGTGGGGGKIVEKSLANQPKKTGTSTTRPPVPSLLKGASNKPQIRRPH